MKKLDINIRKEFIEPAYDIIDEAMKQQIELMLYYKVLDKVNKKVYRPIRFAIEFRLACKLSNLARMSVLI